VTALGHIGREDKRLITVIVAAGRGQPLCDRLSAVDGILAVTHHHARGVGKTRIKPGRLIFDEMDVVFVLVEGARADELFARVYSESGVGEPKAGIMFMEKMLRGHHMMPFR